MLGSLKRLFVRPSPPREASEMEEWARRRGLGFKRARGAAGFVIDGLLEGMPWRMEWGPPQRAYIEGHELRLRMELDLPHDMQLLLLSRPLMETLERQTFEEFTDTVQTTIGTQTPEEMRWLVMFPKLGPAVLKALRPRFGAVASVASAGQVWLDGPLVQQLEEAARGLLRDDPPFVLMTLRGRAYLRLQLAAPTPAEVAATLALFEAAVTQALRAAEGWAEHPATPSSGATTAWQTLDPEPPDDDPAPPHR